ncbi:MAG: MotA/TolQ/ExbB proton channel family protein [Nitrosomonas halophila]|jgi:biopolymer transport protein ExbB
MLDIILELEQFFEAGGFVMPPLLIVTMLLWYCLGYRFWILKRRGKFGPRELVRQGLRGVSTRPYDLVEEAAMAGAGLVKCRVRDLRRCLDSEFIRYEIEIMRFSPIINTVVIIAPLLGLLGTVNGMIETFNSLADMALFAQSGGIAGGISQALFTTQLGLVVAVPGLLFKSMLDRKQRRIQAELAQIKDLYCSAIHVK